MTRKISSIEELIALARENQHIFQDLNSANTHFKHAMAEKYLRNPEAVLTRITKINTYDLELLSVGIRLKRFKLKKGLPAWETFFKKAKKIAFSINIERLTRNTLQIQLEHYKDDKPEDVVAYIEEYTAYHLKKIPSLWELITSFFKNIWKRVIFFFKK